MRKLGIIIVCIVLLFSVLEICSRIYDRLELKAFPPVINAKDFRNFQEYLRYSAKLNNIQMRKIPFDYSPYTGVSLKPNYSFKLKNLSYTNNSLGFRFEKEIAVPKLKDVYRIFILGGSTVQGAFNEQWTISYHLQKNLEKIIPKAEVINSGVGGYSSTEELILLETKILDLEPDLVIIFDGRNDLFYSIRPYWKSRVSDVCFLLKNSLDHLLNYPSLPHIFTYTLKVIARKSSFITRLRRSVFEKNIPHVYEPKVRFKEEAIKNYIDNLTYIKAILEAKKIKGILVFQPTMGYCKDNLTAYELSTVEYLLKIEKTDWLKEVEKTWPYVAKLVSNIPDSQNVQIYDLTCVFKDYNETAYIDSCHYTPAGMKIIAKELARIIQEE